MAKKSALKRVKKDKSLNGYIIRNFVILMSIFGFIVLASLAFVLVLMLSEDIISPMILGTLIGLAAIALFVVFLIMAIKMYHLFYKEALGTSLENFRALASYDKDFKYCEHTKYEELALLNRAFRELAKNFDGGGTISLNKKSYDKVELQYLDDSHILVSESSLLNNIRELVLAGECYRNALVDISYDLGKRTISIKEQVLIVKYLSIGLGYDNLLIAPKESLQGFYLFVPNFDSENQLKEEFEVLMKNISLMRKDFAAKQLVMPYVSAVIYPYSDVDNMVKDLEIAVKQRKVLNFYHPRRDVTKDNKKMLLETLNVNNISRLLEEISSIDADPRKYKTNIVFVQKLLMAISSYYGFGSCGFIEYQEDTDEYVHSFVNAKNEASILKPNIKVNKNFIETLVNVKEANNTYYFSSKKHLNADFARFASLYHMQSGLFHVLMNNERCIGVLYFVNRTNNLNLDTYMKGNLVLASELIANIKKEMEYRRMMNAASERYRNLSIVSELPIYSVNKKSYEIEVLSNAFKHIAPDVKVGDKCFASLYGLNEPCKDCPLLTKKHKLSTFGKAKVMLETYPILKNASDDVASMFVKQNALEKVKERYDDETLLATFYAYKETMEQEFLLEKKGSVMFMRLQNVMALINRFGNGGYVELLKTFKDEVIDRYKRKIDLYLYDRKTLLIVERDSDNARTIELAEYICQKTMDMASEYGGMRFEFSYLVKNYPSSLGTFNAFNDFTNEMLNDLSLHAVDEIYFSDSQYRRSASEEGYLHDTLVAAFNNKTFSINFQPVVSNKTRLIMGAELLMSVIDKENNRPINMAKGSNVLYKRGELSIMSDALVQYVDDLLTKYGYTFFMTSGLNKMSLNVSFSIFEDEHFISKIDALVKKHNLPKTFLSFEMSVEDTKENATKYEKEIVALLEVGGSLALDGYRGEEIMVEDVAKLGFKEIKVARDLVSDIKDKATNERIMSIWEKAHKAGLKITFVGVANRIISEAIHFDEKDCFVQGNYFYASMSEDELFESIRERNMKDKEIDL